MDESQNERIDVVKKRPWELFGFGCHYAWIVFLVFDPSTLKTFSVGPTVPSLRMFLITGILIGYATMFFACILKKPLAPRKRSMVTSGIIGSLGTLLIFMPQDGIAIIVSWSLSGLLIGVSYAFSMTMGNHYWMKNRHERAMMQIAFSCVAGIAVFATLKIMPFEVGLFASSLLPLVGDLILAFSKGGKRRAIPLVEKKIDGSDLIRTVTQPLVLMAGFGVVGESILSSSIFFEFAGTPTIIAIPMIVGSTVSLCIALRNTPTDWLGLLDRVSSPFALVGLAGMACFFEQRDVAVLFSFAYIFGFCLADQFFWVLNADLAFRNRKDRAQISVAMTGMAQWAGFAAGSVAASFFSISPLMACSIIFSMFAIELMARSFLFRREDAVRLIYGREASDIESPHEIRCAIIAKKYALSPREAEVFSLLSQGRTISYIQNHLTLSQSTVKTHTRRIYRKLNVNSRQELIDMVEQIQT